MVYEQVCCIHCGCNDVRKFGKRGTKQRYQCHKGCGKTFQSDYRYNARRPSVKEQIIDIAVNGGGIRDTARILGISTMTVMSTIKKSE